jgi:hypothetical protein
MGTDWETLVLAIGGPALVAVVTGLARWARGQARAQRQLRDDLDSLQDRVSANQGSLQQLRQDLRELRRYVFTRNNRR